MAGFRRGKQPSRKETSSIGRPHRRTTKVRPRDDCILPIRNQTNGIDPRFMVNDQGLI